MVRKTSFSVIETFELKWLKPLEVMHGLKQSYRTWDWGWPGVSKHPESQKQQENVAMFSASTECSLCIQLFPETGNSKLVVVC